MENPKKNIHEIAPEDIINDIREEMGIKPPQKEGINEENISGSQLNSTSLEEVSSSLKELLSSNFHIIGYDNPKDGWFSDKHLIVIEGKNDSLRINKEEINDLLKVLSNYFDNLDEIVGSNNFDEAKLEFVGTKNSSSFIVKFFKKNGYRKFGPDINDIGVSISKTS